MFSCNNISAWLGVKYLISSVSKLPAVPFVPNSHNKAAEVPNGNFNVRPRISSKIFSFLQLLSTHLNKYIFCTCTVKANVSLFNYNSMWRSLYTVKKLEETENYIITDSTRYR